jgi:hypothetical protein
MLVAVRPIHVGAVVETAVALTILATMSDLKASILAKDPHDTQAQSHAEVAGSLEPLVVATGTAVGFRLRMAWANSCGRRWPGPCSRSSSADGSALYARHDLAVIVLWPVEVAAIAFIFRGEERRTGAPRGLRRRYCHTGSQAGPAGTRDPWPARGSAEGAVSEVDNLTARPQLNVAE